MDPKYPVPSPYMTGPDSRNTQIAMPDRTDPDPDPATRDTNSRTCGVVDFFQFFHSRFVINRSFVRSFVRAGRFLGRFGRVVNGQNG